MSNLIRRIPATETLPTLPELFGRLMGMEPVFRGWGSHFWPPVDLEERDDDIRVVSEIPGMDAKDINITVENNILTISGEKKESLEKKNGGEYTECRYGSFARSVSLPRVVDVKKIAATYKDGVLEVLLPKTAEAKAQKIQITAK